MFESAYIAIMQGVIANQIRANEDEAICKMPIEFQGEARRVLDVRREKQRLEDREEKMHRELCESIEKAGSNAKTEPGYSLF
jgi:hypothetical protein